MTENTPNKIDKKNKENESRNFYLSTSFYGALFFSLALWFYTIMNEEYQTIVQIPLTVQLPENKALERKLPSNLNVVAKGNGWNLLNLLYFNNSKNCNINLQNKELNSDIYEVTRQEILKSIEYFQNIETRDILPDNFKIDYGTLFSKKVKVIPDISIKTIENFVFTDSIRLIPDEIEIKGNKEIVDKIDFIKTKHLDLNDINESINSLVEIDDSLSSVLTFSETAIKLNVKVQYKSHIILDNIDIDDYINLKNMMPIPQNLRIIISGGVDDLKKIKLENFYNNLKIKKVNKTDNIYEFENTLPEIYKVEYYPKYFKLFEI